ncbi:MAG TPA: hypothetical protein VGE52_14240 [Pirellulales bacterium]
MSQTLSQAIQSVERRIHALYPYGLDAAICLLVFQGVVSTLSGLDFGQFFDRWAWSPSDSVEVNRIVLLCAACVWWDDGHTRPAVRSVLAIVLMSFVWLQQLIFYMQPLVTLTLLIVWIIATRLPRSLKGCNLRDLFWIQAIAAVAIIALLNSDDFRLIARAFEPGGWKEHIKTIQYSWVDNLVGQLSRV